jgi:hypothetical protein
MEHSVHFAVVKYDGKYGSGQSYAMINEHCRKFKNNSPVCEQFGNYYFCREYISHYK